MKTNKLFSIKQHNPHFLPFPAVFHSSIHMRGGIVSCKIGIFLLMAGENEQRLSGVEGWVMLRWSTRKEEGGLGGLLRLKRWRNPGPSLLLGSITEPLNHRGGFLNPVTGINVGNTCVCRTIDMVKMYLYFKFRCHGYVVSVCWFCLLRFRYKNPLVTIPCCSEVFLKMSRGVRHVGPSSKQTLRRHLGSAACVHGCKSTIIWSTSWHESQIRIGPKNCIGQAPTCTIQIILQPMSHYVHFGPDRYAFFGLIWILGGKKFQCLYNGSYTPIFCNDEL